MTDKNGVAGNDNLYTIQERSEMFCHTTCYFLLLIRIYFVLFFLHGLVTHSSELILI
jgi:hypothetical protein